MIKSICRSTGFVFTLIIGFYAKSNAQNIHSLTFDQVRINDPFWSPKLKVWDSKTVYDVFDKMEGHYEPDRSDIISEKTKLGHTRNAFTNFDVVAKGNKNTQSHDGPAWYDGLVYETITGAADLLQEYPDKKLEKKIDGYVDRIAAAQDADPDGYINTYTTLIKPDKRWGTNGGNDVEQHDIYNAGMLMEAGIHYYRATGKTKLLNVAVKLSNYICREIGPAPRINAVPGHGGPEQTILKLYQLFKEQPALKKRMTVPVNEDDYLTMAKFWIENRGNYGEKDGSHARRNDGAYNQDQMPVLEQQTIEGHAVRATLLATGVTATALETKDPRYMQTASNYWNNMIGKRMFITGGEGAVHEGEAFGANYDLPESAYLETCASMGAGFFSEQMNELFAGGKYMDEFERVIYNNLLSGVSLSGDHYFYENPLIGNGNKRWAWHGCPCCPPMILKLIGSLPQYIYGYDNRTVYVNLFIGSEAKIKLNGTVISLTQTTNYPWKGNTRIVVNPATAGNFTIKVRIPGWAVNKENPFDLYQSTTPEAVSLTINGITTAVHPDEGYVALTRTWKKGDVIELTLPVGPRLISVNDSVQTIKGKVAIASGPVVYSVESIDNPGLKNYTIKTVSPLMSIYRENLLGGINVVTGTVIDDSGKERNFTAIPFYAVGNREPGAPYQVWIPK